MPSRSLCQLSVSKLINDHGIPQFGRLKRKQQGRYGRSPSWLLQSCDGRGLGVPGNTGQPLHLYHGTPLGSVRFMLRSRTTSRRSRWTQRSDCRRFRGLVRKTPRALRQGIEAARILRDQARNPVALRLAQTAYDARPKPGCGAISYAANESLRCRQAWQKDVGDPTYRALANRTAYPSRFLAVRRLWMSLKSGLSRVKAFTRSSSDGDCGN